MNFNTCSPSPHSRYRKIPSPKIPSCRTFVVKPSAHPLSFTALIFFPYLYNYIFQKFCKNWSYITVNHIRLAILLFFAVFPFHWLCHYFAPFYYLMVFHWIHVQWMYCLLIHQKWIIGNDNVLKDIQMKKWGNERVICFFLPHSFYETVYIFVLHFLKDKF